MAGKLGKPCREPRCPEIVVGAQSFCAKHKKGKWAEYSKGRERLAFYGTERWRRTRQLKLSANPMCEVCCKRLASQVHHINRARDDIDGRFNMNNLQSVCVWCHAKETQREIREVINESKRK